MKYLATLLLLLAFSAQAAVVTVQRSQGFTANCDNATTRTDDSPLALAEIHSVTFFMFVMGETDETNYALQQEVLGGCRAVTIVTKDLAVQETYYLKAITTDIDGLTSELSLEGANTYFVQNANPNAPGQVR